MKSSSEQTKTLAYTGERMSPGFTMPEQFRNHEDRYLFAGQFVKDRDVLDIASGSGIGTAYLLRAGAKSSLGIDIDQESIDYSRNTHKGCRFMVGSAEEIPLPDESLDVLVSFETIEHFTKQEQFLKECRRVLRLGGKFICSTPHHGIYGLRGRNPFHLRELYPAEFISMIESEFQNVQAYSQDIRCYPVFLMQMIVIRAFRKAFRTLGVLPQFGQPKAGECPKEFGLGEKRSGPIFERYTPGWWAQPEFVIVTALRGPAPAAAPGVGTKEPGHA